MTYYKPASISISLDVVNSLLPSKNQVNQTIIKWYQSAIGFLMWPAIHIYPSISYSVEALSQYYANPGPINYNLVI